MTTREEFVVMVYARLGCCGFVSQNEKEAATSAWPSQDDSTISAAWKPTVKGLLADANIQGQERAVVTLYD